MPSMAAPEWFRDRGILGLPQSEAAQTASSGQAARGVLLLCFGAGLRREADAGRAYYAALLHYRLHFI